MEQLDLNLLADIWNIGIVGGFGLGASFALISICIGKLFSLLRNI